MTSLAMFTLLMNRLDLMESVKVYHLPRTDFFGKFHSWNVPFNRQFISRRPRWRLLTTVTTDVTTTAVTVRLTCSLRHCADDFASDKNSLVDSADGNLFIVCLSTARRNESNESKWGVPVTNFLLHYRTIRRRSRSRSSSRQRPEENRPMLMSDQEALHQLYGEISTQRDGDVTHQCVQTNLADVICGGNPNDKILYGRTNKRRSASFPAPRSLDRRHSLRLFGSKQLQRCASSRSLHKRVHTTDSSSSTDYPPSVDSATPKKASLLSRLFRRSGRSKQTRAMSTFSAQFPPAEWFNSKAVHLHCVATQTNSKESLQSQTSYISSYYDGSEISNRSSTLPRRHKRHLSTESGLAGSVGGHYDHSPGRHSSPSSGSLPRSTLSRSSTNKTILDQFGSPQRNDPKSRESPSGSLRRIDYNHSDHIMSTSGPSSLESTTTHRTPRKDCKSGPSSLDSQNQVNSPLKRNYNTSSSGHSSLESHISDRTLKPSPSHNNSQSSSLSRAQSLVKVQSLQSSPKSLHKYRNKPPIVGGETVKNGKSTSPRSSPKNCPSTPKKTATPLHNKTLGCKEAPTTTMMASSNSNNSITLKVTTNTMSQNGSTNTKVYVQNSPVRSVITFENGKVTDTSNASNIYIINDDRQVVSVSQNEPAQLAKNPTETSFDSCTDKKHICQDPEPIKVQENKFNKNSINDHGMNNNRKLSLQIGGAPNNNSLVYKNKLNKTNEVTSNPASPAIHNNILSLDATTNHSNPSTPTKSYENMIGSIGSLKYQKNSLSSTNTRIQTNINSNSELKSVDLLKKAAALQMLNGLPNVNNRVSSDSIANLLTKGIDQKPIVIGSEPNLALKNQEQIKDINTSTEKINTLEKKQKRYSLSQESKKDNQDFYNFPSLSDLSFNFTSLAAQKILKGVSINSVDTLVELNMAANNTEKQNNRDVAAVCTDFGLV
ncbi:hypothetical protein EVAR_5655_1 [Eumeta japonica]|uniref:Uncharacterized protein n=1 Tax=Eumeta variegata TaxID=151549 RepID=A0A4C1T9U8_EUMVA|nr:hypothetical protein EVAR_5655_1 [Eumeta japonica]